MSPGTPWRIILVTEGSSDPPRIRALIDHFLQKHSGSEVSLNALRRFEALGGDLYISTKKVNELARERGLDKRYSPGGPKKGDSGTLRKVYQVLQKEKLLSQESVIIWARDDDGDQSRRHDAKEARKSLPESMVLLLAIASECHEAWVIAGWKPRTQADRAKLQKWRRKLGFEPQVQPWRLSHKENVPKSAKDIANDLFDGTDEQREEALKLAADTDNEARTATGLRDFCEEIEAWLTKH